MKISVAMTSYNSEKYISEQLKSILRILPLDGEVVICDDCSTDNTVKIVQNFSDSRIKLIINSKNLGANKNFEKCLFNVKGDIIIISDSDNVWLADKISKVLPIFENKKVGMVMHDCFIADENLNVIFDSYFKWRKSKPGLLRNIIKNGYGGSMMAFRSTLLSKILPFPKKMNFFFDEWIGMVCSKYSKVVFIQDKLTYWRRHEGTCSASNVQNFSKKQKIQFRFASFIKDRTHKLFQIIKR